MLVSEFSFNSPTQGLTKKNLKPLPLATEDSIRENKVALVKDLERKLHFREDANQQSGQQVRKSSVVKKISLMNETYMMMWGKKGVCVGELLHCFGREAFM